MIFYCENENIFWGMRESIRENEKINEKSGQ